MFRQKTYVDHCGFAFNKTLWERIGFSAIVMNHKRNYNECISKMHI